MPRYKVSYTNSEGEEQWAYLEGQSVEWVHAHLTRAGASAVQVHVEDILPPDGRDLAAEGKWKPVPPNATLWQALRTWGGVIACMIAFDVWEWRRSPDDSILSHWGSLVTLATIAWAILKVAPVALFQEAYRARVWHDWPRLLRILPLLERNPVSRTPAQRWMWASLRATALAGLGRIDEAMSLLDSAPRTSALSAAALDTVRSSLLISVRRYDEAIELRRRAAISDPKHALDAAIAMLRYGGDVEEARALLASRGGVALTELERAFLEYARGLLAIADARFDEAAAHLASALTIADAQIKMPPQRLGFTAPIEAFHAVALAEGGDTVAAQRIVERLATFLTAADESVLLERARQAVARSAKH